MKKITLIACAALVAGLLVSCNNATEAGTVDYDSVRNTYNRNNYLVSGKVTETVYTEAGVTYDDKDKMTAGTKTERSDTVRFTEAAAVVSYDTDSVNETNYQSYTINFDDAPKAWSSWKESESTVSNGTWGTATDTKGDETTDPDLDNQPIHGVTLYCVDGTFYVDGNGQFYVAEVEEGEDAVAGGEDFTLKVTYTDYVQDQKDSSKDEDGKLLTGGTSSVTKVSYTYDLTFTAK